MGVIAAGCIGADPAPVHAGVLGLRFGPSECVVIGDELRKTKQNRPRPLAQARLDRLGGVGATACH